MIPDSLDSAARRAFSATIGRGAFSVAVTGISPAADAATFAGAIAAAGAAFGRAILLVRVAPIGGGFAGANCAEANLLDAVTETARQDDGVFRFVILPGSPLHCVMNDTKKLGESLGSLRGRFDSVVIDCPSWGTPDPPIHTPLAAAAADMVLLVATPATTARHTFDSVRKWLAESGAELTAIVLNDRFNPTLAQELTREIGRIAVFAPWLANFVRRRVAIWGPLNRYH